MNEIVKQTIDARKNAIFNSYQITDKKILDKIDDLFKRIDEFAKGYDDVNKFEADFQKSPLNNEYTNIFVLIAKQEINDSKPSLGEAVLERVGTDIKNKVMPSRAVMADKRDQAIRDIPVVGDIVNAKQKIDFFKRFKKDKD